MISRALELATELGADLAGWAALDRGELVLYSLLHPQEASRYHSALVLAKKHDAASLENASLLPNQVYDQDYRRLNRELEELIFSLADFLNSQGVACQPIVPSQTLDQVHHRGLISHRALAERAGLGVRGRNNLLVTIPHRSRVRLASLLTEVPVPRMPKIVIPYPCVACNKCREACPAGALGENHEDYRLDRCLAHLEKIHAEVLSPQICGICLAVCPEFDTEKPESNS